MLFTVCPRECTAITYPIQMLSSGHDSCIYDSLKIFAIDALDFAAMAKTAGKRLLC